MRIAIDGPAGAGKSTIARLVAQRLGLRYLDTGAMYRALTLQALRENISPADEEGLVELVKSMNLEISWQNRAEDNLFFINKEDVTEEIRRPAVSENVSLAASHGKVREIIASLQQKIAAQGSIVMDGRDIGTVVMPTADWKFYLSASVEERARRRQLELKRRGLDVDLQELERQIQRRDFLDSTREVSPLKKAEDAIEIDTTNLNIEQVVDEVLRFISGGKDRVQSSSGSH
ncbi:MAG TPA: (d)CMP kinase [Firmicutes bacterium]|nr:(d)CMP kinase [Bacillota bacterium]